MHDVLDAKLTAKKLVNESGLNEKIKTLVTKEETQSNNKGSIKRRAR